MTRFRPNLVLQGTEPWEEDRMKVLQVGQDVILHVVNGCPRCQQSCTDQETGVVTDEPAATLGEFRCCNAEHPENVYFGVNVIPAPESIGKTISVGDSVKVLEWGTPAWSSG